MAVQAPILALPNELLLHILALLPTADLLPLLTVSHRVFSLILRIIHHRMVVASRLEGHTLLLECYHPSAKLTEPPLFCTNLGTDALLDPVPEALSEGRPAARLARLSSTYTRFKPHRRPLDVTNGRQVPRHPAGDIPGSRTHPSSRPPLETDFVLHALCLEGHELFTQMCAVINLVKLGPRDGLFTSFVEVEDGVVRVWKDWLSRRAMMDALSYTMQEGPLHSDSPTLAEDMPGTDDSVIWINKYCNTGLRVGVQERRLRTNAPILMPVNEDLPVTYNVEYKELYIRTMHLLLAIEKSFAQQENHSGKAVVFGSLG